MKIKKICIYTCFIVVLGVLSPFRSLPVRSEIIDEELSQPTIPAPKLDENQPPLEPIKSSSEEKKKSGGESQKPKSDPKTMKKGDQISTPSPKAQKTVEKPPVHFTSQGLKGLREKGLVELVKDVLVTQGDLKIEADNAQVYFSEESKDVQKIMATGQPVKMSNIDPNTGEKLEAFGNQIHFNNAERIIYLEGNARIKKGSNSTIKGKKITYELDSGWIKADKVAGEISPQK